MKISKYKNLIFVFCVILFCSFIYYFNYKIDPYAVNSRHSFFNFKLADNIEYLYSNVLKSYKNNKNVLIGTSEFFGMSETIQNIIANDCNVIVGTYIHPNNYYDFLKDYLAYHPETERVFLSLNYINIVADDYTPYPGKIKNSNFVEKLKMFLSIKTTEESIKKVKDNKRHLRNLMFFKSTNDLEKTQELEKLISNYTDLDIEKYSDRTITVAYDAPPEITENKEYLKYFLNNNIKYIDDVINLLNEKNIKLTIVIPPYTALFRAYLNDNEDIKQIFYAFFKYIVTRVDEIYDFAIINDYTTQNIYSDDCYLYIDYVHPNFLYGLKVYNALFDKENAEQGLYVKLTKDNIDEFLNEQSILLGNYKKDNKEIFDLFQSGSNAQHQKEIRVGNLPVKAQKEYAYIRNIVESDANSQYNRGWY